MSEQIEQPPARDKYDDAIAYFTEFPERIDDAWDTPNTHMYGCLFRFLTPSGRAGDYGCGCPTMVKGGGIAYTDEITQAVRNDDRIPSSSIDITPACLPAFAEIQRLADRTIRNVRAI